MLRIGILGCGTIAAKVADSLKGNKKVVIEGVASRERNKAKKFASVHCPDAKVFIGSRNKSTDGYSEYTFLRKVMSKTYIKVISWFGT